MNVRPELRHWRVCAICGQSDYTLHIPSVNSYAIIRCRHCGLVFADPLPDAAELEQFYAHYAPEAIENGAQSAEMVRDLLLKEVRRLGYDGTSGDLLDIGCGYGFFLQAMQGLCSSVTGIELSAGEAAYAGQKLGLNVRQGTLEEARFPDSCFDTVTMWGVIEHLPDPIGYLREIWRILKPARRFVGHLDPQCMLSDCKSGGQALAPMGTAGALVLLLHDYSKAFAPTNRICA